MNRARVSYDGIEPETATRVIQLKLAYLWLLYEAFRGKSETRFIDVAREYRGQYPVITGLSRLVEAGFLVRGGNAAIALFGRTRELVME